MVERKYEVIVNLVVKKYQICRKNLVKVGEQTYYIKKAINIVIYKIDDNNTYLIFTVKYKNAKI